jgi:hypothetical protein
MAEPQVQGPADHGQGKPQPIRQRDQRQGGGHQADNQNSQDRAHAVTLKT